LPSSDFNVASTTPASVAFALSAYSKSMEFAQAVGARWLAVNSGRKHMLLSPPDDRLLSIYADALGEVARCAATLGMRVLIENIPGCLLDTAESLATFLDNHHFDNVDVLYDVANAAAIGENPVDGIRLLKNRIAVVHLSDAQRGLWRYAPIGGGDIDFGAIRHKLDQEEYAGEIVLEVISNTCIEDFAESRKILASGGWAV